MNVKMKTNLNHRNCMILLSILLFIILFNPPIFRSLSFTVLAVIFSIVIIILNNSFVSKNVFCKQEIQTLQLICLFLLYITVFGLFHIILSWQKEIIIQNIIKTIVLNICIVSISLSIAYIVIKNEYSILQLIDAYVYCGVMQSIISIASYFLTDVRNYFNSLMVTNIRYENIARLIYNSNGLRCFGFAANLFDTFGCAMSMIAILAFYIALSGRKKFLIYFFMISFSAIINSRTSIVLLVVGIVMVFIFNIKKRMPIKIFMYIFKCLIFLLLVFLVLYKYMESNVESISISWIKSGIDSISSLLINRSIDRTFRGANTNYFGIAFDNFFFIPDDMFALLFGTGMTPEDAIGRGSDVAYIKHIWQYGIIGSLIQYSIYIYLIKKSNKIFSHLYKGLPCCLGVLLFIYLIKNEGLGYSMPSIIIMPIVFSAFSLYSNILQFKKKT